jgi:hypothetical protein
VEENFCTDFVCCGVTLPDLHALLQHYEESHVKMEDCSELEPHHPNSSAAVLPYGYSRYEPMGGGASLGYGGLSSYYAGKRKIVAVGIETQDGTSDTPSAFDTTIFRTVSPTQYQSPLYGVYPPKRPRSAPVTSLTSDPHAINTLRAMLPPAFANAPADNSLKLIHSALSSTINPPRPAASKRAPNAGRADSGSEDDDDGGGGSSAKGRPYVCLVPGCGKTYKNPNGLKYHTIHGHDRDGKDTVEKPHRCPFPNCAKRYKNPNGLKYHIQHGHPGQTPPGKRTVASLKSIAGLNQIEAAIKREQALRAQLAAQSIARSQS